MNLNPKNLTGQQGGDKGKFLHDVLIHLLRCDRHLSTDKLSGKFYQ